MSEQNARSSAKHNVQKNAQHNARKQMQAHVQTHVQTNAARKRAERDAGCVCLDLRPTALRAACAWGADVSEELVAFLYDCSGGVDYGEFDFQYPMLNYIVPETACSLKFVMHRHRPMTYDLVSMLCFSAGKINI